MSNTKQNKLKNEIQYILKNMSLDPQEIIKSSEDYFEAVERLKIAKDLLVRITIIGHYVFINELLDVIICNYFFGKNASKRKKRYKLFSQHILERLTLPNKLALLSEFLIFPKNVNDFIYAINGLRNAFAHSFFPENRIREKPIYKKKDIYKIVVLDVYYEDYVKVQDFLLEKSYNIKSEVDST